MTPTEAEQIIQDWAADCARRAVREAINDGEIEERVPKWFVEYWDDEPETTEQYDRLRQAFETLGRE